MFDKMHHKDQQSSYFFNTCTTKSEFCIDQIVFIASAEFICKELKSHFEMCLKMDKKAAKKEDVVIEKLFFIYDAYSSCLSNF